MTKWGEVAPLIIMNVVGTVCVVAAVFTIVGTISVYFFKVFPLLFEPLTITWGANLLISVWFSFNLIYNYAMVVRTPAGFPDPDLMTPEQLKMANEQKNSPVEKGKGWSLWCHKCNAPKPERAHHCPICESCVLKMDHHCPWINSCVGWNNHRYFVLFLFYLLLSVSYAVVTIVLFWSGLLYNRRLDENQGYREVTSLSLCFVVCLSLTIVIGGFFSWSAYLAVTNQTTIEYLHNQTQKKQAKQAGRVYRNPYNRNLRANLRQVFGEFTYYWEVAMPSTGPIDGDGHVWPSSTSSTEDKVAVV